MGRNESEVSRGHLHPVTDVLSAFPSLSLTGWFVKQLSNNSSGNRSFNSGKANADSLSQLLLVL